MKILNKELKRKYYYSIDIELSRVEMNIIESGKYQIKLIPDFDIKSISDRGDLDINGLVEVITNYFNVRLADVIKDNRLKPMVYVRMFICAYLRKYSNLTHNEIGSIVNRNHATVIYMLKKFEDEMIYDDMKAKKEDIDGILDTMNLKSIQHGDISSETA